jgi:hypothetical protein
LLQRVGYPPHAVGVIAEHANAYIAVVARKAAPTEAARSPGSTAAMIMVDEHIAVTGSKFVTA